MDDNLFSTPKNLVTAPYKFSPMIEFWRSLLMAVFFLLLPAGWFFPLGRPFAENIYEAYVTPGLFLPEIGLLAAAIATILVRGPRRKPPHFPTVVFLPLIALPFLAAVTASLAISPPLAWLTCLRWTTAPLIFLIVWRISPRPEKAAGLLLLSLALQALIAAGQAAAQSPLGLPGEMLPGLSQAGAPVLYTSNLAWLRAAGLSFHPNVLGGFLSVGLIVALPLTKRWPARLGWWLAAAGLLLTFSRSAWLAAAVSLPLAACWLAFRLPNMRRPLAITLGVAALAGLATFLPLTGLLTSRLQPFSSLAEATSISGRGELIAVAMALIRQSPFSGVGAGNFPLAMLPFPTMDPPHYVHHTPLLLASEVGLVGGLLWYWLWLFPVFKAGASLKGNTPWAVVFPLALLAFGLIALFDSYPWALAGGRILFAVLLVMSAQAFYQPSPG
jgi:O-antigen ligase